MQVPEDFLTRISPLTGKEYLPIIQTNYGSESEMARLLEKHNIHTVICTLAIGF